MNLAKSNLVGLPVYTQSGQHLGRIYDFELDADTQLIVNYHVRSGGLIRELLQKELVVAREQVITISLDKMVVDDALTPIVATKKQPANNPAAIN